MSSENALYVENGCVGVFVNRKYGTSRAAFGVFVVKGWIVNQSVVSRCLSPD